MSSKPLLLSQPASNFGVYYQAENERDERLILLTPFMSLASDTVQWGNRMLDSLLGLKFDTTTFRGGKLIVRVVEIREAH